MAKRREPAPLDEFRRTPARDYGRKPPEETRIEHAERFRKRYFDLPQPSRDVNRLLTGAACAGLLLLLCAVIALLDLINLFSALSYGIISALSVLAGIAYIVSYFAAIFFAGKHLLGSLKK